MLVIRLKRVGKTNDPSFRIVVTEKSRGPKSGNIVEKVGFYNPQDNVRTIEGERVKHWISEGAKPSPTVHNLLVTEGIIDAEKINVLPQKSPVVSEPTEGEEDTEAPVESEGDTEGEAEATEKDGSATEEGGGEDEEATSSDAQDESSDEEVETEEEKE